MKIIKSEYRFPEVRIYPNQIHKFRGFVGETFKDYDLIHNHDPETGKPIYRYPLIQFKLINGTPTIVSLTESAVSIFSSLFMKFDQIIIDELKLPVFEKDLYVEKVDLGYSPEKFVYEFISPWIALNQHNYHKYIKSGSKELKNQILKRNLIGNILSMGKYLDCWLKKDQTIEVEIQVREKNIILKGQPMLGFTGIFKTNFIIPDHLGLGKSVSRGYGTVRRVI